MGFRIKKNRAVVSQMGIKLKKNKGLIYWDKAKKIIPGGNGLLSKRPERFAPDIWPTYFNKCYGNSQFSYSAFTDINFFIVRALFR